MRPSRSPLARLAIAQAIAATALVFAAAACEQPPDAPLVGAGRYVLTSINGRALPAVVDTSATEFGVVLADTVTLDGRGAATRTFTFRRVSVTYGEEVYHPSVSLEYRVGPDSHIVIGSFQPCPDLCIGNDEGTVVAERLELVTHWYGQTPHLEFVRVPN